MKSLNQPNQRLDAYLLACTLLVLLTFASSAAQAIPVQYDFNSGFVTLSATVGDDQLIDPLDIPLAGIQVTLDTDTNEILSMEFVVPGPIDLTLNQPLAGYDMITIERILMTGTAGTLTQVDPGPPTEYFYVADPVDVELTLSADGPAPFYGPLVNEVFTTTTVASGTLFIDDIANTLNLSGITIGIFGPFGDEELPVVLKGDFVFSGDANSVPEPTTTMLFSIGLIAMASSSRRRSTRRS
jgi:hypothetical protein